MNMKKNYSMLFILAILAVAPLMTVVPLTAVTEKAAADDPIKIGYFAPMTTASLSFYAPWSIQGFELGLDYATDGTNATPAGRPYEITYYDTKGSVTDAATLAVQAIETDQMDILAGATYSSVAGAIAPIAEEYETLFFMGPAADASLTADNFNPYIFRIARNNWHDAKTGVSYMMDTIGAKKCAFLAADYSFGYSGVETMKAVIEEKGGSVTSIQYASLFATDFSAALTNLITADAIFGIDALFIIWAGDFTNLYKDMETFAIYNSMNVSGAVIDIFSMNAIEASFGGNSTLVGGTGLCVYGYELPDNDVNDWMVAEHKTRNIKPNGAFGLNYKVPELFTASGFGTAQFIVDVTSEVKDLDVGDMINHLESNLTITTPKGPTRLRPEDHQGLSEMYIAEIWQDDRPTSETFGFLIAKHVQTLSAESVAPPVLTDYEPGSFGGGAAPGFDITTVVIAVGFLAAVPVILKRRR